MVGICVGVCGLRSQNVATCQRSFYFYSSKVVPFLITYLYERVGEALGREVFVKIYTLFCMDMFGLGLRLCRGPIVLRERQGSVPQEVMLETQSSSVCSLWLFQC